MTTNTTVLFPKNIVSCNFFLFFQIRGRERWGIQSSTSHIFAGINSRHLWSTTSRAGEQKQENPRFIYQLGNKSAGSRFKEASRRRRLHETKTGRQLSRRGKDQRFTSKPPPPWAAKTSMTRTGETLNESKLRLFLLE